MTTIGALPVLPHRIAPGPGEGWLQLRLPARPDLLKRPLPRRRAPGLVPRPRDPEPPGDAGRPQDTGLPEDTARPRDTRRPPGTPRPRDTRPRPDLRLRLRRLPKRMLRKVRHPNLWIPRRDLLLPRREFPQLRRAGGARNVTIPRPREAEQSGQVKQAGQVEQAERVEQAGRVEQAERAEQAEQAKQAEQTERAATQAGGSATATASAPRAGRRDWPLTVGAGLGWLALCLVLYTCYLHVSRTMPANSDGASNALQAWAMLHGNPLLRGWVLSDVSFYTTELPQYMLIELARGLTPDVMHIAGAMTYAVLVVLAARLAKGGATGVEGLLRAGLAAGIMVAPQLSGVYVLMLEPDHVGSAVPVIMLLLLLDRTGRRWWVPPLAFALIGWALVADQVVLLTAAGPLAFVALARAYNAAVRKQAPGRSAWFEVALAVAAVASVVAASRAIALIKASGGFTVWPVTNLLAPFAHLPGNLQQVVLGILVLFGANFPGQRVSFNAVLALLHLVAVGLVAWAVAAALRRFAGADLVVQVLAVAVLVSILAYLLSPKAGDPDSSREFAAVLPFGAALAGRLLAGRLQQARLIPALAAVFALYVAGLLMIVGKPPAAAQNQALASWLAAHKLTYGLADYWLANSTTVASGGKVAVRAIQTGRQAVPYLWEAEPSWYSAAAHLANFVVLPSVGRSPGTLPPTAGSVLRLFGQPATVYFLADYTVLVWNTNLLGKLA